MIDRRQRLEEILNEIEPGWVVVKPVLRESDHRCVFQKPDELKEACANIPRRWFDDGEDYRIEQAVRDAIARAVKS